MEEEEEEEEGVGRSSQQYPETEKPDQDTKT